MGPTRAPVPIVGAWGWAQQALIGRLRTREVVPRDRVANFRDHARMVDTPLLKVIGNLQKKHGQAFASEAGLRRMIAQDTGHMPGVDTIPTALERLERTGILEQQYLAPGGLLPDGSPCTYGTRLVWLPQSRVQRRGLLARNRRERVTGRPNRRALQSLASARSAVLKTMTPPQAPREEPLERRRQAELARLAELEASWARKPDPDKPPD